MPWPRASEQAGQLDPSWAGGSRTLCVAGRQAAGTSWPTLPGILEAIPQETTWSAPRPPEAWPCAPALPLPPKSVGGTQLPGSPRPPQGSFQQQGQWG